MVTLSWIDPKQASSIKIKSLLVDKIRLFYKCTLILSMIKNESKLNYKHSHIQKTINQIGHWKS